MAQQSIIASGASFSIGLGEGVTNLAIGLSGTFGSGNFTFEASCDGGATWDPTDATRSVGAVVESVTGVLTGPAAPAYSWDVSVGGYTHFRMRCTALASGTALIDINPYRGGPETAPVVSGAVTVSGTATASGTAAHSAAASGNPVQGGGVVRTAADLTLVAGDAAAIAMTSGNQQLVKVGGLPELDLQTTTTLTTNADVAIMAAGGASIRNYLTDLTLQNTNAVATTVALRDGTTALWSVSLPASMALPVHFNFNTPKRSAANTALNLLCGTTGANVLASAGGYRAF